EPQQSVSDIADVTVSHVVDHHRIAGFDTAQPLFYRAEPLGCCSTVIYKLFKENDIEIPAKLAGLMLSAIISDTLLLKSPT
ncbi:DHH family phosphoesterase, partial [Klebsiella pneumoniae]|nr:DHH family phosphoesterase [Klebsiella pneumoniae]